MPTDVYKKEDPFHYKTNPGDAIRRDDIINSLGSTKYKRALDIGCGEGFVTQKLPADEIFGYDLSPIALSRLPLNVKPLKRNEIVGKYDLIIVSGVLQSEWPIEDVIRIINEHASGTVLLCHRVVAEDKTAIAGIKAKQISQKNFPYSNRAGNWENVLRIFDASPDMEATYIFHNIGTNSHPNYHTKKQVKDCSGKLTFDGVYLNVYENRHLLENRDVILYFIGDYVGENNSFDQKKRKPIEYFCDMDQLRELESMGCILGWHTWSHSRLTQLSDEELQREVTPPFPMDWFSYPYGDFDERVIAAVKKAGFKYAHALFEGDNTPYQQVRKMI